MGVVLRKGIAGSDALHRFTLLAVVGMAPLRAIMDVEMASLIHERWFLVSLFYLPLILDEIQRKGCL